MMQTPPSNRESLEQLLNSLMLLSTRFRRSDSVLEDLGLHIAALYAKTSLDERQAIVAYVGPEIRKKLFSLMVFMAEEALNSRDPKWVRGALLIQLIEDFGQDYRESYRYLVLVHYSASVIDLNLMDLVSEVAPLASDRSRRFLTDFCQRDHSLNRLASFGVREHNVDGRSRFVPI